MAMADQTMADQLLSIASVFSTHKTSCKVYDS